MNPREGHHSFDIFIMSFGVLNGLYIFGLVWVQSLTSKAEIGAEIVADNKRVYYITIFWDWSINMSLSALPLSSTIAISPFSVSHFCAREIAVRHCIYWPSEISSIYKQYAHYVHWPFLNTHLHKKMCVRQLPELLAVMIIAHVQQFLKVTCNTLTHSEPGRMPLFS